MLNKVKIWFAVKTDTTSNGGVGSFTTQGTSPCFFSLPKIPKVFDYLRDPHGNFYRVVDPILRHKDETEIMIIKVDESDTFWEENTKEGGHILLPS